MDDGVNVKILRYVIQNDAEYKRMLKEFRIQELEFDRIVGTLPLDVQDIIWEYVSASNELDEYALLIASRLLNRIS